MSEQIINPISKVDAGYNTQVAIARLGLESTQENANGVLKPSQSHTKSEREPKPIIQNGMADVFLRFRVDDETNEITVYVIDRASKRVLRTIPPEELSEMKVGELVELLA